MRPAILLLAGAAVLAAVPARADAVSDFLGDFGDSHAATRAAQPSWSSPLVTTTGLLEQRLRFDIQQQHAGNGADTTELDNSRAVDLIVGDSNEIQMAFAPFEIRTAPGVKTQSGFADGSVFRFEQRLASSPASADNYVVTTWLQVQAPLGITSYTNKAWQLQPTVAVGKGWGDFDIQATVGGVIPTTNTKILGDQAQTNIAFQYHVMDLFWPELEVNWTYYGGGQRNGLNQVYLTPGVVIGRFDLTKSLKFTFGVGYQTAVAPNYRPKPLTPALDRAWLFTSRINF